MSNSMAANCAVHVSINKLVSNALGAVQVFVLLLASSIGALPASAQMVLYDNFDTGAINPSKWGSHVCRLLSDICI